MTTHARPIVPDPDAAIATPTSNAPLYLLGNGQYAVLLTRTGAGYSAYLGNALYRWTPDPVRQLQGFFLYIRDLDTGDRWSAGYEPLAHPPCWYEVGVNDGSVSLAREDDGIVARVEICVVPDDAAELRRLTLTNQSDRARRLDVTSYLEVALADLASDAAHPAFSKLFIQTAWLPEREALLAWRRPRNADEPPRCLVHRLIGGDNRVLFETDRHRFLGRGRSPANPWALDADADLSGTVGNVLDPICSIRRMLVVAPGTSVTVTALLGAAPNRAEAAALAARYGSPTRVEQIFAITRETRGGVCTLDPDRLPPVDALPNWEALALPHAWTPAAFAVPLPLTRDEFRHEPAIRAIAAPSTAQGGLLNPDEQLRFFNGIGGFTFDGLEYVIRLDPHGPEARRPAVPWSNVIANERIGCLATESGVGFTWAENSRRHRLTPWSNDPVTDPPSEVIYVRDEEAGSYWSPTPLPAPGAGGYEVRHGLGYTRYLHRGQALEQDLCVFVARTDPVKIALLTLRNQTERVRRLTVFAFARWILGAKAQETSHTIETRRASNHWTIYAVNRYGGACDEVAFASLGVPGSTVRVTSDRTAFLGPFGTLAAPAAVTTGRPLDGRVGTDLDPCAAFEAPLTMQPGEMISLVFLLGQTVDESGDSALVKKYSDPADAQRALDDVSAFWRDLVSAIQISTPVPAIDLMVNGWLAYQTLSCRLWGRSAFYQSGGAFGFRDQLQDAAALVYFDPQRTRAQILLHAAHQFREGDVLHWWHSPDGRGIRTRFSDDLLWLPYISAFYVRTTGDEVLLDELVQFISGPLLAVDEAEISLVPQDSGEVGSVYEHCCRAIDRSLTYGSHGLPLIGSGDWNDGMNRVGRAGRGESIWLGFFLYDILDDFIPIAERRRDVARASLYRAYQHDLARALEDGGWDGAWYRRAYYDDGTPLGSAMGDECRIDAIAQAWAVLSNVAPPDRAARALDALEEHLVSEEDGLIRLLTPPFDRTPADPGYIKGYLPGVRENGGQYTHGALWAVRALAEAGRTERAATLLEMLSPVSHGGTAEKVAVYQAEPYVIAADVYGTSPHIGRAGWSWYTGSSGWMLRVTLESLLGFDLVGGRTIRLRVRLPHNWPGYQIRCRVPNTQTRYDIDVRCIPNAVLSGRLDENNELVVEGDAVVIPLAADNVIHRVSISCPGGERRHPR